MISSPDRDGESSTPEPPKTRNNDHSLAFKFRWSYKILGCESNDFVARPRRRRRISSASAKLTCYCMSLVIFELRWPINRPRLVSASVWSGPLYQPWPAWLLFPVRSEARGHCFSIFGLETWKHEESSHNKLGHANSHSLAPKNNISKTSVRFGFQSQFRSRFQSFLVRIFSYNHALANPAGNFEERTCCYLWRGCRHAS